MMERDWHARRRTARRNRPHGERFNLATPRSRCPHCGHLITRAREHPHHQLAAACAAAAGPLRRRHQQALSDRRSRFTGVAVGLAAWHFGFGLAAVLGALLFIWALVALAFIDLDTQLLPDDITLPLLWLGLLFNLGGTFTDLPSAVIGAMAGYLALWSVYWLFKLATGKEGMGYGDFKLLAPSAPGWAGRCCR
jgi:leader peptidase (prepilin peptidase)/N-methyltransferase